jgi:hypothetical protein
MQHIRVGNKLFIYIIVYWTFSYRVWQYRTPSIHCSFQSSIRGDRRIIVALRRIHLLTRMDV